MTCDWIVFCMYIKDTKVELSKKDLSEKKNKRYEGCVFKEFKDRSVEIRVAKNWVWNLF